MKKATSRSPLKGRAVGSNLQNSILRFPGEIFRVLKEKEEKQYGEYRTKRLVLEAWDKLEAK